MPLSLGTALSEKYSQQPLDPNSLLKGFQVGEQADARRLNRELTRQSKEAARQAKEAKMISDAVKVDVHPWDYASAKKIADEGTLYAVQNFKNNPYGAQQSLQQTASQLGHINALKENRKQAEEKLSKTESGRKLLKKINDTGDISKLINYYDPISGYGVAPNGMIMMDDYEPVDYQKSFKDAVAQHDHQLLSYKDIPGNLIAYGKGLPRTAAEAREKEKVFAPYGVAPGSFQSVDVLAVQQWQDKGIRKRFKDVHDDEIRAKFLDESGKLKAGYTPQMMDHEIFEKMYVPEVSTMVPASNITIQNKPSTPRVPPYDRTPDQLFTKTPLPLGKVGGRESFNGKYGTKYTQEEWQKVGGKEAEESQYVAISPKSGVADTESILIDIAGKPFKPQGYQKIGNKVYAAGAVPETVPKGTVDNDDNPVFIEKLVPKRGILLNEKNLADVAAHYHFSSVDDFKQWISAPSTSPKSSNRPAANKPKTVRQNGVVYTLNEKTREYE